MPSDETSSSRHIFNSQNSETVIPCKINQHRKHIQYSWEASEWCVLDRVLQLNYHFEVKFCGQIQLKGSRVLFHANFRKFCMRKKVRHCEVRNERGWKGSAENHLGSSFMGEMVLTDKGLIFLVFHALSGVILIKVKWVIFGAQEHLATHRKKFTIDMWKLSFSFGLVLKSIVLLIQLNRRQAFLLCNDDDEDGKANFPTIFTWKRNPFSRSGDWREGKPQQFYQLWAFYPWRRPS